MNEQIIYVNGDSFTHGTDLEDELFPWFDGPTTRYGRIETRTAEQIHKERDDYVNDPNTSLTHREIQNVRREKRWSTKLEGILGSTVSNISSVGGSSMYTILHKSIQDLHQLRADGKHVSHVILQLTGTPRLPVYYEKEEEALLAGHPLGSIEYPYNVTSCQLSDTGYVGKKFLLTESYNASLIRFFYDLYVGVAAIKSEFSIEPIFVDSVFHKNCTCVQNIQPGKRSTFQRYFDMDSRTKFLDEFVRHLEKNVELSMDDDIDLHLDTCWTSTYHLTESVHNKFAQRIAERYF